MARFADVPLDDGSPKGAVDALNQAIAEDDAVTATSSTSTAAPASTATPPDPSDARFAGKSFEEIKAMYRNLESHAGRLASQLGESRNSLNALILGKRDSDLHRATPDTTDVKISPMDLMQNPTDVLDRYLTTRENKLQSTLQERLNQLEAQLAANSFSSRHQDAETVTADPEFAAWCRQTPLRMNLAQRAAQSDYAAADMLLTEWNTAKKANAVPSSTTASAAQTLANKVALESRSSAGGSGTKPKGFKRADLIALRQSDPDKYESPAFQRQIIKAYQEGRVYD